MIKGIKPTITNIVCTSNFRCTLNIKDIALKVKNQIIKYDKIRNEIILQIKNPKTTARIFASGKMLCLGAK